jgi:hypothetical protein
MKAFVPEALKAKASICGRTTRTRRNQQMFGFVPELHYTTIVPWHYTSIVDLVDHWQTLFAGLFAFLAAVITAVWTLSAESRKACRERQAKDLMQINSVASAVGYNIEALLHTVMQQILPHREQSHAALAALRAVENNSQLSGFFETMHSKYTAMMTRCPEPYFIDL